MNKKNRINIAHMSAVNKNSIVGILILLVFAIFAFAIYSNTLHVPFYFDDADNIRDNPYIRLQSVNFQALVEAAFNTYASSKRPLGSLSFALNYCFHQYRLHGYHLVNIFIHFCSGFLLFIFIKMLLDIHEENDLKPNINGIFDHIMIPLFAALIWLVHPLHTNSVTYIVQRMNSMASMFYLLSLILYMKGRIAQKSTNSNSRKQIITSCLCFSGAFMSWVLSLGCKEITAVLPFFILLFEFYFFQNMRREWLYKNIKYFLAVFIIFIFIGLIYTGFDPMGKFFSPAMRDFSSNEFTLIQRMLTQYRVVIYYSSLAFFPHYSRLNIDYSYPLSQSLIDPASTLLCFITILSLITFSLFIARKNRIISFCLLWFFGNLAMESTIIPLAIIFEHRTYLPTMLIPLILIVLVRKQFFMNKKLFFLPIIVILLFSFWTYQRNTLWGDKLLFWEDCVKKSPNKDRPRVNLGKVLISDGRYEAAIQNLSVALQINKNALAHINMGVALEKTGRIEDALYHYQKALVIDPDQPETHNNIASILEGLGKIEKALFHYKKSISLNPYLPETHYNLGVLLYKKGLTEKAISEFKKAVFLEPKNEKTHNNLGSALLEIGKPNEASKHFFEALQINPDYAKAYYNLGIIFENQVKLNQAIGYYRLAIQKRPDYMKAHLQLANAFTKSGELDQAISVYKKTLRLRPNFDLAYYNIASLYSRLNKRKEANQWLKKSVDAGYDDWALIISDPNLEAIRQTDAYLKIISSIKQ